MLSQIFYNKLMISRSFHFTNFVRLSNMNQKDIFFPQIMWDISKAYLTPLITIYFKILSLSALKARSYFFDFLSLEMLLCKLTYILNFLKNISLNFY